MTEKQWPNFILRMHLENTIIPCQDQYFAGGLGYGYGGPYSITTSAASVDVSTETLVSFWAAGLRDNSACQHEPQQQDYYQVDAGHPECFGWTDHLSPQLQRNKLLQDTLLQREEELARLHDENNKLKEYLNSTLVKCLEEKAKLLHGVNTDDVKVRNRKRRLRDEALHNFTASQLLPGSYQKKTRRNLSLEFCTAEEVANTPPVDSWVLQTLGLKDLNTIDESANYSAISSNLLPPLKEKNVFPTARPMDYNDSNSVSPAMGFRPDPVANENFTAVTLPLNSSCCHQPASSQGLPSPLTGSTASSPFKSPYSPEVTRSKPDVAFTMSLNPHRNVKTHSFDQGQAFVRRDENGGWKFTWVPKQSD
ncbi:geminin coiled-coil domain-containing protein 1 isoform X2 [Polypterus senegalus]|uniref:geminin coiled-coil domain-containing protein 1 isoform X2 n=1 Tax=Polypterus senegalus TaxID=55291 RepID=UPI00196682BC|nr:geminin coiled-coil domain-containing protein 1 isoform X2 [Polypterus senegalus]